MYSSMDLATENKIKEVKEALNQNPAWVNQDRGYTESKAFFFMVAAMLKRGLSAEAIVKNYLNRIGA